MEITRSLLLILHFIGMAGLLGGLLASSKSLNKGVLHSSLLALVAGLGLVGIRYPLNEADPMRWDSVNHTQVGGSSPSPPTYVSDPEFEVFNFQNKEG